MEPLEPPLDPPLHCQISHRSLQCMTFNSSKNDTIIHKFLLHNSKTVVG